MKKIVRIGLCPSERGAWGHLERSEQGPHIKMTSEITGIGSALPRQIITNAELSPQIGLNETEITKKTGIVTRHWVSEGETTATLAIEAAKSALKAAQLPPDEIDLIIVSTSSPDMIFPSVACLIQKGLAVGMRTHPIGAFDINASCSGFLYALSMGEQYIKNGRAKNALIIASEVKSVYLDKRDPQTACLFGDGAGAVILSIAKASRGIKSIHIAAGGMEKQLVFLPAGGSRLSLSQDTLRQNLHTMKMEGTRLFRLAVKKMDEAVSGLLKENAISLKEIDLFVFHQANLRILEAVVKKQGIPKAKHHTTIWKYGNTSSASLSIALDDAVACGRIKPRDKIALFAFGG
ncbi:MAG: beta-ketoacyl-ACP synthase 3, partial [Nitrospirae bacterium]|nr:beta-ketoacyl-ACP synthase 3 [Candidatus Troglogloeales bacterium]